MYVYGLQQGVAVGRIATTPGRSGDEYVREGSQQARSSKARILQNTEDMHRTPHEYPRIIQAVGQRPAQRR